MAILYRFICSKHGEFDAWGDQGIRCPMAKCRCKPRQMVTAPAVHGGRTQSMDNTLKGLAKDFNMTDIKSVKEGDSQSGYLTRNNTTKEPRPGDGVLWGDSGRFNMQSILTGGAARPVRDEQVGIKPSEAGVKSGPRTASYIQDHENLKIKQ